MTCYSKRRTIVTFFSKKYLYLYPHSLFTFFRGNPLFFLDWGVVYGINVPYVVRKSKQNINSVLELVSKDYLCETNWVFTYFDNKTEEV